MARLAEVAKRSLGNNRKPWRSKKGSAKVKKVMHEWGQGKLRRGSKKGPRVTSQKQAVAIALSESRRAGK